MDQDQRTQEKINRGNMAEIAWKDRGRDFVERNMHSGLMTLIQLYREGKSANELLAIIGELSALDKMAKDFQGQVHQRNAALKKQEDQRNAEAERARHKDYG